MTRDILQELRAHGVQPSAQRVAIAQFVLETRAHPTADQVFQEVKGRLPVVSRATVYNTLNTLVERGLLRQFVLREGSVVFDPKLEPHHHFIDQKTGHIFDIPWDALKVLHTDALEGLEVADYQVVLRGRARSTARARKNPPRDKK